MNNEVTNQPATKQEKNSHSEAIKQFAAYFELLDQIDRRLKKEDPEYQAKYYPDEIQAERQ